MGWCSAVYRLPAGMIRPGSGNPNKPHIAWLIHITSQYNFDPGGATVHKPDYMTAPQLIGASACMKWLSLQICCLRPCSCCPDHFCILQKVITICFSLFYAREKNASKQEGLNKKVSFLHHSFKITSTINDFKANYLHSVNLIVDSTTCCLSMWLLKL
jgi:hypothetical protein